MYFKLHHGWNGMSGPNAVQHVALGQRSVQDNVSIMARRSIQKGVLVFGHKPRLVIRKIVVSFR